MPLSRLFKEFFSSKKYESGLLVLAAILSMVLANMSFGSAYIGFWEYKIAGWSLLHLINDGLMTIFFLLVGLELEREIYVGELSVLKNALLPVLGAVGGLVVPALLYLSINRNQGMAGMGIPMATDIAFSLGMLALFGSRVPIALKVFLAALAISDDLGAILVIAIFYTKTIAWLYLLAAAGILAVLYGLSRLKILLIWPYMVGGFFLWLCVLGSGVHATISGVLLAFVMPFGTARKPISKQLQHRLHLPVAYIILPLFALANTCLPIDQGWYNGLLEPNSLGIIIGLVVGKPLGILAVCVLVVKLGICTLPDKTRWPHMIGAALLAGIGFTMSIFISLLAFQDPKMVAESHIAVLVASVLAALLGAIWFLFFTPLSKKEG